MVAVASLALSSSPLPATVGDQRVDKLAVYATFPVAEVWTFRDGAFTLYAFDRATGEYALTAASALVPGLDFGAVARYAIREDTPQALWEFEDELER